MMTKAWLRQVIVLCTLHSINRAVVALMSDLKLRVGKPWKNYMKHGLDGRDPLI